MVGKPVDSLLDEETRTFTRSKRWIVEREKESIRLLSENRVLKIHEEKLLDVFGILAGYIQLFMDITLEHRLREEKTKLEEALADNSLTGDEELLLKRLRKLKVELDTMDWSDQRAWNLVRRHIDHLNEAGPAASIAAAQSGGKLH